MKNDFRIDMLAGLADNELNEGEIQMVTNELNSEHELQTDLHIQILMSKIIREKLQLTNVPERLKTKIIKKIKVD